MEVAQDLTSLQMLCCTLSREVGSCTGWLSTRLLSGAVQVLVSDAAGLAFPIVAGIPNLKPDAGVPEEN